MTGPSSVQGGTTRPGNAPPVPGYSVAEDPRQMGASLCRMVRSKNHAGCPKNRAGCSKILAGCSTESARGAIAGTGCSLFPSTAASSDYSMSQMQDVMYKIDELIRALRRV